MPEVSSAVESKAPIQVTKAITFTGAAGAGAAGIVTVFTVTGRVFVTKITAFCTTLLTESGATATMTLGTAVDTDAFIAVTNAVDIDANEWWTAAAAAAGSKSPLKVETGGLVTSQVDKMISENIIITVAVADVTGGVLVVDVWYEPITVGGNLA